MCASVDQTTPELRIPTPSPASSTRVRFPVWVKLGVMFGGVYGLAAAAFGAVAGWNDLEADRLHRRQELEDLAFIVASGLDAEAHAGFRSEKDRAKADFARAAHLLRYVNERSDLVYYATTCTRDEDGGWRYVVDGDDANPYPVGFPIFDGIAERERAYAGEPMVYAEALQDDAGRWDTAMAPIRGADGAVVGVVELIADADQGKLVRDAAIRRTVIASAGSVGASLVLAFVFGRLLSANLAKLVVAARAVAEGRLDTRVDLRTRDEVGLLADTFNGMVEGLQEREFIRDTFGRFVNKDVVAQILEDKSRLRLGGERRVVTVLMSDLRGFTALGEELGPERMVALLNAYLARMTAVVERYDGNVAELLGDGLVVLFGAPVNHPDDATRAISCAVAMHHELQLFNQEHGRRLQMGIGVDTGSVIAGNIGDERHMKYGVVGAAINVAARLESFTLGNQVLASQAALDAAGPTVLVDEPLSFRAKGRRAPLLAYPVRGVAELRMPDEYAGLHVNVELSATLWRVEGKQVGDQEHHATVTRVEQDTLVLTTGLAWKERDKLKLAIDLQGTLVGELYAVVEGLRSNGILVRLTSVPGAQREALDRFLAEHAGDATGGASMA